MLSREELNDLLDEAEDKRLIALSREICGRLLIDQPNNVYLLAIQANNLIRFCLYEEAAQLIQHAERTTPLGALKWVLSKKGDLRQKMGDFKEAEVIFMEAHTLDPDQAGLLVCAASAAFDSGNIMRAVDLARRATLCANGPVDEAFFNLGGYLLVQKKYEEARDCYKRALEIDPNYAIARTKLEDIEKVLELTRTEQSEKFLRLHKDR
jgi:tetratricopeptide (TPR) repeat protein